MIHWTICSTGVSISLQILYIRSIWKFRLNIIIILLTLTENKWMQRLPLIICDLLMRLRVVDLHLFVQEVMSQTSWFSAQHKLMCFTQRKIIPEKIALTNLLINLEIWKKKILSLLHDYGDSCLQRRTPN